jgi:hypothetical protein
MNRRVRFLVAAVTSSAASACLLAAGLLVDSYAVRHGVANDLAVAVTICMVGVVAIPAVIVKKLLVDYW